MTRNIFMLIALILGITTAEAQVAKIYKSGKLVAQYTFEEGYSVVFSETKDGESKAPDNAQAVDLGLSVKWANMNVGATTVTGYGTYFAWGEVKPQTSNAYNLDSYKWCSNGSWNGMTKYTCKDNQTSGIWYNGSTFIGDGKTTLDPEDDAATVNWGGDWRMPTLAEQTELFHKCTSTWTSNYNGTGVAGRILTSKINGNSIFLPASGFRGDGSLDDRGSEGVYWSSSLKRNDSESACGKSFNSGDVYDFNGLRSGGFVVRAVCQ